MTTFQVNLLIMIVNKTATVLIFVVAVLHTWFMILESFLWAKPIGMKIFKLTPEKAQTTKVLAQNQGLYNGFLAAGLFWALLSLRMDIAIFFLSCVVIAGIVGGFTVSRNIIFVQSVPAIAALVMLFI